MNYKYITYLLLFYLVFSILPTSNMSIFGIRVDLTYNIIHTNGSVSKVITCQPYSKPINIGRKGMQFYVQGELNSNEEIQIFIKECIETCISKLGENTPNFKEASDYSDIKISYTLFEEKIPIYKDLLSVKYENLNKLADIMPKYFKLDLHIANKNARSQEIIKSFDNLYDDLYRIQYFLHEKLREFKLSVATKDIDLSYDIFIKEFEKEIGELKINSLNKHNSELGTFILNKFKK